MPQRRVDAAHFSEDTQDLLSLLHENDVRYLIVGGEAVIFYGHVRLTGDIDLLFDQEEENVQRLHQALEQFWSGPIPGIQSPSEFLEENVVVQFGLPPNRVDFIGQIDGVVFSDAWERRVSVSLVPHDPPAEIHFIAIEDLITNKELAGRPKDLDDLDFLRAARSGEG